MSLKIILNYCRTYYDKYNDKIYWDDLLQNICNTMKDEKEIIIKHENIKISRNVIQLCN